MWVVTSLGISCFFPLTNRFISYSTDEREPRHFDKVDDIPDVYEDLQGTIWLLPNKNQLYRLGENMRLEKMPFRGYAMIRRDALNREWAVRDTALFRLDAATKRPVDTFDLSRPMERDPIGRFTIDHSGRYWLSAWAQRLWLFDPAKKGLRTVLNQPGIYREPTDWEYEGRKWIVVPEENSGFYLIDPTSLQFREYFPEQPSSASLQGTWFRSCFTDRSGRLWVCSDRGVYTVASGHTEFDVHSLISKENGGADHAATGLPFGYGEVDSLDWVNVRDGGTYLVAPADMHVVRYFASLSPLGGKVTNQTSSAYSFYRSGNDLYISTDSGLVDYLLKENVVRTYFPAVFFFAADFRNIVPMGDNLIWIRSWDNGIYVFDMLRKSFIKRYANNDSCKRCVPLHLNWMMKTRHDKLFLTADGGLLLEYDRAADSFIRRSLVLLPGKSANGASPGNLYGMAEDESGKLWICSRNGILVYNPATAETEKVFSENGQMGETYRICFDNYGNAWANGFSGVWYYERSSGKWIQFTSRDGLPPGNAEGFMERDRNGLIWCGIQRAVVRFYPSRHFLAARNGSVIMTEANIAGRSVEFALNNRNAKVLELQPGENSFTLDFAVLNDDNTGLNQYYYRLDPLMKDFEKNDDGHLNFTGLSPGTYHLLVNGGDKFGNVFPVGDSLSITIKPHFYQTVWLKIILLLLLLGAVGLIAARIVRNIRREADLRQKISQSEMMALRAQMNPHFIFNCLSSIDNLIQDDQKEKATTYLTKFAKLIRAILELSKKETVPCWKDLEALQLYLEMESLRLDRQFGWSFDVDDRIIRGDYKIPPMILQPFVENAIHHGLMNKLDEDKRLKIEGRFINGSIRFAVEDNGIGRSKAAEYKRINKPDHQSMGMEITLERMNHFNDRESNTVRIIDLYDKNGSPAGTRIEVWINNQN
jgi:ligand-binding sensor domain-containing protein